MISTKYLPALFSVILLTILLPNCGDASFQQGKNLYTFYCADCHMDDGTGLEGNIPPLAQSDYLKNHQSDIACIIRYGQQDTIQVNGRTYTTPMAGIPELTEFQIANIINYINQAWGNANGFVIVENLRVQLENCDQ
jgi:mono/diheme cytochrome c family protein